MYPDEFEYHRPATVGDAIETLVDNPDAEVLAGGHSLIPAMKTGLSSPDALVDIGDIDDLTGIDERGGRVRISALTDYATIHESDVVNEAATVLSEAAGEIGDVQVRNRGTIGGNVAHADPASDLPGAVLAADATVTVAGPDGRRTVAVDEFFHGMYETDVGETEILTGIEVPAAETTGSTYVKRPSPSSGYALVGVAAALETDGEVVESARVAANGVMDRAVRLTPTESALEGVAVDDTAAFADAAGEATTDLDEFMIMDDLQASSEFRANLLRQYTERAVTTAVERCG